MYYPKTSPFKKDWQIRNDQLAVLEISSPDIFGTWKYSISLVILRKAFTAVFWRNCFESQDFKKGWFAE